MSNDITVKLLNVFYVKDVQKKVRMKKTAT